jgi:O-antigen ligase
MSKTSTHSLELGRARSNTPKIDISAVIPILACAFPAILAPLIYFTFPPAAGLQGMLESRPENRIFWPAMAAISVVLALRNHSRLGRLTVPPHIICLVAYLTLAGASVLWAFKPEISLTRFVQEVMVLISIVLPAMVAVRTTDMMRGLFLCFAFASILNLIFVLAGSPVMADYGSMGKVAIGYSGYFTGKNLLGEFAAIALLLALHEMLYSGVRRAFGIIIVIIAISLLLFANSKTALGFALFVPCLAGLALIIGKKTRISLAIVLLFIPICYIVLSNVSGFNMNRISYMLYGDSTFTGRTLIWDFAQLEIARRPFLGWGYQSFWLVGADAPSIVDARGWIKGMPNAHNGYYDTMLETGYVGLAFLITLLLATLHAIGRVADRDRARAWLLLSLVLFIILYNFLETLWMRAFDLLWVVFVIAAAEIARHWQPFPVTRAAYGPRIARPGRPGPMRGASRPRLRMPM